MLTLLVGLIILALIVWGARIVIAAIGAPAWLVQIVVVIAVIIAVIMVANFFGVPTPKLTLMAFPYDPGLEKMIGGVL